MFAKKDLGSLRNRIGSIQVRALRIFSIKFNSQVNARMGKISKEDATSQTVEVLVALKKLGEKLSPEEDNFLRENRSQVMADFDKVGNEIGYSTCFSCVTMMQEAAPSLLYCQVLLVKSSAPRLKLIFRLCILCESEI